jgi:hypothetical protein
VKSGEIGSKSYFPGSNLAKILPKKEEEDLDKFWLQVIKQSRIFLGTLFSSNFGDFTTFFFSLSKFGDFLPFPPPPARPPKTFSGLAAPYF